MKYYTKYTKEKREALERDCRNWNLGSWNHGKRYWIRNNNGEYRWTNNKFPVFLPKHPPKEIPYKRITPKDYAYHFGYVLENEKQLFGLI